MELCGALWSIMEHYGALGNEEKWRKILWMKESDRMTQREPIERIASFGESS